MAELTVLGYTFETLDEIREWAARSIPLVEEPEEFDDNGEDGAIVDLHTGYINRLVLQQQRILRQMWEKDRILTAKALLRFFVARDNPAMPPE